MKSSLILFILFLACSPAVQAQELTLKTQDFPPYAYLIDDKLSGPAVEIIHATCEQADLECHMELLPWARAQDAVKHGKDNGLFVLAKTPERTAWLAFSYPLFEANYGFFVRSQNLLEYTAPSDISGYHIGVYGPSNTSKRLESIVSQAKGCTVEMRPDDEAGFKKLNHGRIDAVYSNKYVGDALISKMHLRMTRYAGTEGKVLYYLAFSKRNTEEETIKRFNEAYLKLHEDGSIAKILDTYNMKPVPIKCPIE
ncbi:transporter substrate-binding domain-containing protein [uncultured Pseudodesulfovibrio sp.]|uniref:substrate-binding periplasmic protein n=1 Tax=uncultured Pseudodesulfovibrio sp. TaxID=2035858 RepID=UPI0029C9AE5A|nr:transporter substrate-binding domain-containing protein [uncultured Pseudodesulfovibrio sp.]